MLRAAVFPAVVAGAGAGRTKVDTGGTAGRVDAFTVSHVSRSAFETEVPG